LITLGIIGIVAAMTLPSVVANHKAKELEVRFKKAYSILWNIHMRMISDYNGVYEKFILVDTGYNNNIPDLTNKKYEYINVFKKYLTGAKLCTYSNSYLSCNAKSVIIKYKTYTGNKDAHLGSDVISDKAIVTNDGMCFFFGNSRNRNARIYIDTNGNAKGPNRLGFDLFAFDVDKNDKIIFPKNIGGGSEDAYEGDEELEDSVGAVNPCSIQEKTNKYNGFGCSEFALTDKNPDNQNLSYWKNLPK
jgi:hypothetical protein